LFQLSFTPCALLILAFISAVTFLVQACAAIVKMGVRWQRDYKRARVVSELISEPRRSRELESTLE
jgi:hypothetical protein